MVALDIDGTLVDWHGRMPDAVKAAVLRAAAEVPVVLSTGRSWMATKIVADQLGLPPGYAVSSNGAVVVTYPPFELLSQVTFDPAQAIAAVSQHPNALIAVEEVGVGYRVSADFPEGELYGHCRTESLAELASRRVTRVIVRDPSASDNDFIAMASGLGLHGVSYFIGYSAWLDIAPEGVDKASALQDVCDRLSDVKAADVLALGDGRNDIEMLRWAGRGVAIGDAVDDVKAAADHVTGRFSDGGTVEELSRWFPA